jgi:hypothetical protein
VGLGLNGMPPDGGATVLGPHEVYTNQTNVREGGITELENKDKYQHLGWRS